LITEVIKYLINSKQIAKAKCSSASGIIFIENNLALLHFKRGPNFRSNKMTGKFACALFQDVPKNGNKTSLVSGHFFAEAIAKLHYYSAHQIHYEKTKA